LIGNVFERRLIEAYITENGKDPVTNEDLTVDDLIAVKTAHIVRPRPPTLTSIPSLLSVFQNEWDALALDSYNIRQQLAQTRQELTTALYQHDAAVRVIARLTRERDEARDALSKITIISDSGVASNGDSMQVDSAGLPEELAEKVDETQEKLSKSRRKRPIPKDWASAEDIEGFDVIFTSELPYPGSRSIAVHESGELAIVGGSDSNAGIYSLPDNKILTALKVGGGAVTDAVWYGIHPVISTSSGAVKVFKDGEEAAAFTSHAGSANALAMHPSGEILASVGADKSFVFYDLVSSKAVSQVYTDCGTYPKDVFTDFINCQ
jgi:pre-mRNA-processing factor 19